MKNGRPRSEECKKCPGALVCMVDSKRIFICDKCHWIFYYGGSVLDQLYTIRRDCPEWEHHFLYHRHFSHCAWHDVQPNAIKEKGVFVQWVLAKDAR